GSDLVDTTNAGSNTNLGSDHRQDGIEHFVGRTYGFNIQRAADHRPLGQGPHQEGQPGAREGNQGRNGKQQLAGENSPSTYRIDPAGAPYRRLLWKSAVEEDGRSRSA